MEEIVASKFKQNLWEVLQVHEDREIAAIVRCDKLDDTYVDIACAMGLTVDRQLRLITALAVRGKGYSLLKIAQQPWVLQIELDQTVTISD